MTTISKSSILTIYKKILTLCKIFPSKNRDRLYKEIQNEFKQNKLLTDKTKIDIEIGRARKGIDHLSAYCGLKNQKGGWSVTLEENPMPNNK